MRYTYEIRGLTNSGKPAVDIHCSDCKVMDFYLVGYLYSAELSVDPRENIEIAVEEFVNRINAGDYEMFSKPSTCKKLEAILCHCDPDVIDMEHVRAVRRAKAILEAGLRQMRNS